MSRTRKYTYYVNPLTPNVLELKPVRGSLLRTIAPLAAVAIGTSYLVRKYDVGQLQGALENFKDTLTSPQTES